MASNRRIQDADVKGSADVTSDARLINDTKIYVSSLSKRLDQAVSAGDFSGGATARNFLFNGAFDIWQRGTSVTVANGATGYQADRWYANNSLGTNGVLTFSRVAGTTAGALYAAKVQITTAPTAAQTNGTQLLQTLDNLSSQDLFGKSVSGSAYVKAFGNVNQIGIAIMYKTSEAKVDTVLGSESLVTVNSSTFTLASVLNQAVGTTPTSAGVVGFRIRITGVSSGNTYDLNNGFSVELACLNIGATAATFSRQAGSSQAELDACQRFYEKSYSQGTAPGSVTTAGQALDVSPAGTYRHWVYYKSTKRTASNTTTLYSPDTGASGKIRDNGSTDVTPSILDNSDNGFRFTATVSSLDTVAWHYTAEDEI
jgi:hypothetical protein